MIVYNQKSGELQFGKIIAQGYSGNGEGKNNPDMESVKGIGPIPKGTYTITKAYTNIHTGKVTMNLIPSPKNEMYGRGDFRIHGDSIKEPGTASHGCIIMPLNIRLAIDKGKDKTLVVI